MSLSAKREPEQLITENLDIWTAAIQNKASTGRGSNKKQELYGIKKLRELILELAVRGLLVPQDPNDEPASVLLEKIAAEKEQLIKDKKIKKPKNLPSIGDEEEPFDIPESWKWQRLTDVFYPISVSKNKVKTSEIQEQGSVPVVDQGQSYIAGYVDDSGIEIDLPGPVIIFGDHTSNLKYVDFNFVAGADGVKILRPICCDEKFFYLVCQYLPIENRGYGRHYSRLTDNLFPLPPETEQPRIVAKVDELMTLCDQLEQQTETSLNAHQTLVETLLKALLDAAQSRDDGSSKDGGIKESAFEQAWQRIADHFDVLFTTEHSIDQLKQTILQLAVMGKLVPQDPNDEPASVLLEKIAAEKERLVKEGKIKKQKKLPPIGDEEKPFELPEGWEYERINTISIVGTGATPARDNPAYYTPAEFNWVTSGETSQSSIAETNEKISSKAVAETNVTIYPPGTLVIAMYGQGKTRGQITELLIPAGTNQACAAMQLVNEADYHRAYIKLYFQKAYEDIRSIAEGGAQPNLNVGKISKTVIPLPPIQEQQRIVEKVGSLISLCDSLKVGIRESQTTQLHLADAMAEEALG